MSASIAHQWIDTQNYLLLRKAVAGEHGVLAGLKRPRDWYA